MKKIFTLIAVATFAMTANAQKYQQYFRVEFNAPIISDGSGKTSVAAMGDSYTYCNPEHNKKVNDEKHGWIDIQGGGNLTAYPDQPAGNLTFRPQTANISNSTAFFLENGRYGQDGAAAQWKYQLESSSWGVTINNITAYSILVEKVELIDSTTTHEYTHAGNNKTYQVSEFTFNRLPRNVAELKTLMENADGSRVEATNNPLFIAAVMQLVWPRLLDCSQDCRDMINYLYGVQYSALQTYGIANATFQEACITHFSGNGGKDSGGGWLHNNLFMRFAGATPGNQYKPNGKDYWTGPYKVRVGWSLVGATDYSQEKRCTIANIVLFPNPDAKSVDDMGYTDPTPHVVHVRSTKTSGWFFYSNDKTYYILGKAQYEDF